ncbi:hypothetical protein [Clostridium sp. VAP41]|uniref:hypothetical protein n=1 Tax=Clostridium sp. VAP41 TaxID=2949979 RepID=UPI002079792B|nr:hypothetical protein [Clostridium sp. VAP41]
MENLITFISKFEGIIGAILGTVATLITTQLLKGLGKIKFYFYDFDIEYYGENEHGITAIIEDISKAEECNYKFRLQLYNSSEIIKVLKDFQIEFILENKSIFNKPNNENEIIKHEIYCKYKDFNAINIQPKQLIEINMSGGIKHENMIEFSKVKKVYFIAKNHKNRKIKKLIKKF